MDIQLIIVLVPKKILYFYSKEINIKIGVLGVNKYQEIFSKEIQDCRKQKNIKPAKRMIKTGFTKLYFFREEI